MRIDGQRAITKAKSISFVARVAPTCLIRTLPDTFRKPRTWSCAQPVWRKNRCNGPCAWKFRDGKCFFADVPIVWMYFERTPITTSNGYKVRFHIKVFLVRPGVVPRRYKRRTSAGVATFLSFRALKGYTMSISLLG